jgi:hypothetical protein
MHLLGAALKEAFACYYLHYILNMLQIQAKKKRLKALQGHLFIPSFEYQILMIIPNALHT